MVLGTGRLTETLGEALARDQKMHGVHPGVRDWRTVETTPVVSAGEATRTGREAMRIVFGEGDYPEPITVPMPEPVVEMTSEQLVRDAIHRSYN